MKRWRAVLLLGCIVVGGCSGLQARGPMVAKIDGNAVSAAALLARSIATPLTTADARALLLENAVKFSEYADAKTVNWFAYAFGDKTIFVNGEYATRLDRIAVLAAETEIRALAEPPPPDAWLNAVLQRECRVLLDVKDAKDGKGTGQ